MSELASSATSQPPPQPDLPSGRSRTLHEEPRGERQSTGVDRRRQARPEYLWPIDKSPRMRAIDQMVEQVAPTDATVLLWGESGVGKEIVARLLHQRSPRASQPFVKVNCAALPMELLESELFGYERGAFTGAHRPKPGKYELADKGTIVLDEIGEMPLPLQAKLLHVLQDGRFARLGSRQDIRVDVRVVALTNKELPKLVAHGLFREDLYYRLNVVSIRIPPLRERREEIPVLIEYFLSDYTKQYGRPSLSLSLEMMTRFMEHQWPGNVRELENLVKRLVVLGTEDSVLAELPTSSSNSADSEENSFRASRTDRVDTAKPEIEQLGLKEIGRRAAAIAERAALLTMLQRVHWNRGEAARRLKISYTALLYKMKKQGLDR